VSAPKRIPVRTRRALFNKLKGALLQGNRAIPDEWHDDDADFIGLVASIGELLDRYSHVNEDDVLTSTIDL
jgi:hypothetical protein